MKTKTFIFLFLIATTFGCLDSDMEQDDNNGTISIIGQWEWVKSVGGLDGRTETPTSTGNTITLDISANSIDKIVNDVLEKSDTYSLIVDESIFGGQRVMILYGDGTKQTFQLRSNALIIADECFDCFIHTYSKK